MRDPTADITITVKPVSMHQNLENLQPHYQRDYCRNDKDQSVGIVTLRAEDRSPRKINLSSMVEFYQLQTVIRVTPKPC